MLWSNGCKVQGKISSHILKKSPIALTYSRIFEGVTESKRSFMFLTSKKSCLSELSVINFYVCSSLKITCCCWIYSYTVGPVHHYIHSVTACLSLLQPILILTALGFVSFRPYINYVIEGHIKCLHHLISLVSGNLIWLYQSLTAHQHHKGHTVPKGLGLKLSCFTISIFKTFSVYAVI